MKTLKHISALFLLTILFFSCTGNSDNSNTSEKEAISSSGEVITVDVFMDQVDGLVGEHVKISGLVNHVCRHGGQRMFIVGEGEDSRMKIVTSENIAEFSVDLEGSEVIVNGVVEEERIDEAYLTEWEMEVEEGNDSHEDGIHDGTEHAMTEEEMSEQEQTMQRITDYRKQIEDSGKGYLAFYSIKAEGFEEKQ